MFLKDQDLKRKADKIRDEVIKVAVCNKAGHIAPSLSSVDILAALYYRVMKHKPQDTRWEDRDRMVLSKAHGCYALYAILADLGVIPKKEWEKLYTCESTLRGCMERRPEYGLEAGCGSLGHGLPIGTGIALAAKLQRKKYHVFCFMGDGETQEGTTWEALQFAVKHKLNNLTVIIDNNKLQAMDFVINIMDVKPDDKIKRLKGFGLRPVVCPGHDVIKLAKVLKQTKNSAGSVPKVVIADTTKGFGLKCMQSVPKFHFRIPTEKELCMGKNYE